MTPLPRVTGRARVRLARAKGRAAKRLPPVIGFRRGDGDRHHLRITPSKAAGVHRRTGVSAGITQIGNGTQVECGDELG